MGRPISMLQAGGECEHLLRIMRFLALAPVLFVLLASCSDDAPSGPAQKDAGATCSVDDDCGADECHTKLCSAGRCIDNPSVAGTTAVTQQAGDCLKNVCNADGSTGAVPDDSDAPASTECAAKSCKDGAVVDTPAAAAKACTGGLCDGKGACKEGLGKACGAAGECPSGFCVDGVCCNEACTGVCTSCSNESSKGVCANVPYYKEDPYFRDQGGAILTCDVAIAGARCDGKGGCKRVVLIPCNLDENCMSNKCSADKKSLGAKGELCNGNVQCASGTCSVGACL